MERKFLEELGLEKDIIDKVLDANSADIGKHKKTIEALETERDGLKEQLGTAGSEIQSYKEMDIDGIKKSAEEWEKKHKEDTKTLREQLSQQEYRYAVEKSADGLKFSSNSAKKAFVTDLVEKGLPLEEGKLIGFDDFVSVYKESDAGAFLPDKDSPVQLPDIKGVKPAESPQSAETGGDDPFLAGFDSKYS